MCSIAVRGLVEECDFQHKILKVALDPCHDKDPELAMTTAVTEKTSEMVLCEFLPSITDFGIQTQELYHDIAEISSVLHLHSDTDEQEEWHVCILPFAVYGGGCKNFFFRFQKPSLMP
jgi:hypothetical protein